MDDDVERLMQAFSARGARSSPAVKLNVLMDLERLPDGRVVSFLQHVLGDPGEPAEVRMHVLKRLRNGPLTAAERASAAGALSELMLHGSSVDLQLQAALALGEFTDVDGVLSALGSLALETHKLIDLRYSAFTSLERAGPTPECVNLLRQLSNDEILGRSAQSALARWHLGGPTT
jgi:hypothetical protein